MAGLESIVRPFQRPNSLATRRLIASREKIEVKPAILSWGKAGTIEGAHQIEAIVEPGVDFTVVHHEHWAEEARETFDYRITQKITNADGTQTEIPANYVDVRRPEKLRFKKLRDTLKGTPDEMAAQNEKQVYADSMRDSAALAPFVSLADQKTTRQATYQLSNDPSGTRNPDSGHSVP